jgi:acetyl esterase/lipase
MVGVRSDSMETELDVKYGSDPRQSMDIFPTHTPDCPILVFIHGGYWTKRAKNIGHFLAPFYVNLGINFISPDYRLVPEVSIREIIENVRRGIIWLNSNSEKFRVDRQQIFFIAGHSAGGHLRQSSDLATALKTGKQRVLNIKLKMRNHFSACEAFSEPKSPLSKAMLNLILN